MAIVGSAYVIVHANTSAVKGEIERAFDGARRSAQDAGDQAAQDFSDKFGSRLRDEMAQTVPDAIKADMKDVANEMATNFSDEFDNRLGHEMNDNVARALRDDEDGVRAEGDRGAGQYSTGFFNQLRVHMSGIPDVIGNNDLTHAGDSAGSQFATGVEQAVGNRDITVDINADVDTATANIERVASTAIGNSAAHIGKDNRIRNAISGLFGGGNRGGIISGAVASLIPDSNEIHGASEKVTELIGVSNLLGPAIAQVVAGLSSLVEGLFAVGAAAAQSAPALIVLPSIYTSIFQSVLSAKLAFRGMATAVKAALDPTVGPKALQADLKGLTPVAQDFVLSISDVRDEITGLQKTAQQGLFPGLTESIGILTQRLFPVLDRVVGETNTALGSLAANFSRRIVDPSVLHNISIIGGTNTRTISALGSAIIDLGAAFTSALAAASPLINRFTTWVQTVASSVSAFLQTSAATGSLTDTFNQAGDAAAQLGRIGSNLVGIIVNLGRSAIPAGQSMLDSFEGVTANLRDMTASAEGAQGAFAAFNQAADNVRAIGNLLGDLGGVLADIGSSDSVAQTFNVLREGVPAVRSIVASFTDAGPALADLVVSAVKLVDSFTQTNGITIFLETLRVMADILNTIVNLPGISQLLAILIPIAAVTRGIAFAWEAFSFVLEGTVGVWALNAVGAGNLLGVETEAGAAGAAAGEAITAAMTEAAIATAAETAAMEALAVASAEAGVAGAGAAAATEASAVIPAFTNFRAAAPAAVAAEDTAVAAESVAAETTAAAGGASLLSRALGGLKSGFSAAASRAGAFIKLPIVRVLGTAGVVVGGLALGYHLLRDQQEQTAASFKPLADAYFQANTLQRNQVDTLLKSTQAWQVYSGAVGDTPVKFDQFKESFQTMLNGSEDAAKKARAVLTAQLNAVIPDDGTAAQHGQVTASTIDQLVAQFKEERDAANAAAQAEGFINQRHKILSDTSKQLADQVDAVTASFNDQVDSAIAARDANAQVNVTVRNLKQNFKDLQTRGGKLTGQGFLDLTSAFRQVRDLSSQLAQLGRVNAAQKALSGVADALKVLRNNGDLSAEAYRKLLRQFNLTPGKINIQVTTEAVTAAAAKLVDLKKQRLEIRNEFGRDSIEFKIADDAVKQAQNDLDRLRAKYVQATNVPPAKVRGVDTSQAEKDLNDFAHKKFDNPQIEAKAETEPAFTAIKQTASRAYNAEIFTKANTQVAAATIAATATRHWPNAEIVTQADVQNAIGQIQGAAARRYPPATIPVNADTSAIAGQIGSAVRGIFASVSVTRSAQGSILPGYAPGRDIIPLLASPGEAIIRPEAVRAIGPNFINSLNKNWRKMAKFLKQAFGGDLPKFATGGLVPASLPSLTFSDFREVSNTLDTLGQFTRAPSTSVQTKNTDLSQQTTREGDTWIINPAKGMNELELAEIVSRRQAWNRRRGT